MGVYVKLKNNDALSVELSENLQKNPTETARYKDSQVIDFVERIAKLNPLDMLNNNNWYHNSCYSNFANTSKSKRGKMGYNDSIAQ